MKTIIKFENGKYTCAPQNAKPFRCNEQTLLLLQRTRLWEFVIISGNPTYIFEGA